MGILNWLLGKAPDFDTPMPPPPNVVSKPHISAPPPDIPDVEETEELEQPDERGVIDLEPVYCVIDYCDAQGQQSRRRITLLKLRRGPNAPMLLAVCHERKAQRTFRCDRIECFITDDGETIEADKFFQEVLFVDLTDLRPAETPKPAPISDAFTEKMKTIRSLRSWLRPQLSILVTAARCDDEFHPAELDVICCYLEEEVNTPPIAGALGRRITPEILNYMTTIIAKMRPQRKSLPLHLQDIAELQAPQLERLTNALRDLILADGRIVAEETLLISELAELRASIDGANWSDLGLPEIEWE